MSSPKLIVSDLDGTFLDQNGRVSELNLQAVRSAAELGVQTVIATGRPLRWMESINGLRDLDPILIACNGALIKKLAAAEVLHSFPLDATIAAAVAAELRAELGERAQFAVEYVNGWAYEPTMPREPRLGEPNLIAPVDELLRAEPVLKLIVLGLELPTHVLAELSEPIVAGRLLTTYSTVSDNGLLEFSAPGISKASALQLVLDDLGIPAEDVIAFGDMPNDLDMLQMVGMPYRMSECHHALEVAGFPEAGSNADSGVGRTLVEVLNLRADQ